MKRRSFLVTSLAVLAAPAVLRAEDAPEKPRLALGVGGKPVLYYLPLTIAERKGFFEQEGLQVDISDFAGGAKALQALVGGSVDVVTGAYEHTIRMQAKGQDIRAACELGRFPGICLVRKRNLAGEIKTVADLKGRKIGVSAPGSSTHNIALYAMKKAGLNADDAAFISVGAGPGAVVALQRGEIEAMSNAEPIISKLEEAGSADVMVDTRTEAGTRALFGGSNPAACLYAPYAFMERNPRTMQRLTNAFVKTLKWLAQASPEEVAATVPEEYLLGDKPLYIRAVKNSLEGYSRTGIIGEDGMRSTYDMLKALDPELAAAQVDLSKTFVDRFVRAAASAG